MSKDDASSRKEQADNWRKQIKDLTSDQPENPESEGPNEPSAKPRSPRDLISQRMREIKRKRQ